MASCSADKNSDLSDSGYIATDSGCGTEQSIIEEDISSEAIRLTENINFIPVVGDNACQIRAIISSNASSTYVATTRPTTYSTTNVLNAPYDQAIQDVRRVLSQLEYMSPNQQRLLNHRLNILSSLRHADRERVSEYTSSPEYRPHTRPLSEAAIRQNERARRIRECDVFLRRSGYNPPHKPVYSSLPVRYNDAYDDLIGTRSLDDGSAGAYAERDGDDATYAIRFMSDSHNGLTFQRGHLHITTENRHLVEARQARALAGLTTEAMDGEIEYRVLRDLDSWGWLGQCVRESEWERPMRCYCERVGCRSRELSH